MRAQVLGTVRLESPAGPVARPGGRVGDLLDWLLLRPNETIGMADLAELLWPDDVDVVGPDSLKERLYGVVRRLRQLLADGDDHGLRLHTDPDGYRLGASDVSLDRVAFELAAERARAGDPDAAVAAGWLWRDDPYDGVPWSEEVAEQRRRLVGLRDGLARPDDRSEPPPTPPTPTHTKFLPREVDSASLVDRPRLLDRLGRVGDSPVLSVSAPGGFGKTVLLSQWAASQESPVGWVSLDEPDNDPVRFWTAVRHGLATAIGMPDSGLAPDGATAGSRAWIEALAATIARAPGRVGLVLDDFHRLTERMLLDQVTTAMTCLPDNCTIAVAARPPLAVALEQRLPGRRVRSFDADDLRFDADEVDRVVGSTGDDVDGDLLRSKTEGWPLAVAQLARSGAALERVGSTSVLGDYILHELRQSVPDDVADFVLRTAVLDGFTEDLAATVASEADAAGHLAWLRRHGLSLFELQSGSGVYRYHELIREVLEQVAAQTPGIDLERGHRRAARWYRDHDQPEPALRHAVAGGAGDVVAEVAGDVLRSAVADRQVLTVRAWLDTIEPAKLLADRAAHDLATLTAGGWTDRARCATWVASRSGYGEDDLLPRMIEGHVAYLEGRAGECVAIIDECLERLDDYCTAHPEADGIREIAEGTLRSSRLSARILAGELHHDDPDLPAMADTARPEPSLALWLHGEWAFLALVEGNTRLAAELVAEVRPHLASMDELTRCLCAGRLLVARSLLESDRSPDDPATQQRIVTSLTPLAAEYRRLDWDVELVPVLLALQVATHRLGDLETAAAWSHEVDVLLDLCPDAPLLVAARYRFDPATAGGAGPVVDGHRDLTPRERSVIAQLRASRTYDEIAARLGVSRHTVADHVKAIYRKLGVRSRHGAVRRARAWSTTN